MKKIDLVNAVAAETGMNPAHVRKVMDSTLGVIRRSLESGVDVAAAPLGHLRVVNVGEGESARRAYRLVLSGAKPGQRVEPAAVEPAAVAPAPAATAKKKRGWFGAR